MYSPKWRSSRSVGLWRPPAPTTGRTTPAPASRSNGDPAAPVSANVSAPSRWASPMDSKTRDVVPELDTPRTATSDEKRTAAYRPHSMASSGSQGRPPKRSIASRAPIPANREYPHPLITRRRSRARSTGSAAAHARLVVSATCRSNSGRSNAPEKSARRSVMDIFMGSPSSASLRSQSTLRAGIASPAPLPVRGATCRL